MPEQEWIKILNDGRKVKFTRLELAEDAAFITKLISMQSFQRGCWRRGT
jgi:hypothetical protein